MICICVWPPTLLLSSPLFSTCFLKTQVFIFCSSISHIYRYHASLFLFSVWCILSLCMLISDLHSTPFFKHRKVQYFFQFSWGGVWACIATIYFSRQSICKFDSGLHRLKRICVVCLMEHFHSLYQWIIFSLLPCCWLFLNIHSILSALRKTMLGKTKKI